MADQPPHIGAAEAIRHLREKRGLSARALSLKAGLSASYVGKFEKNEIEPSIGIFSRIAVALDMNPFELWYCVYQYAHKEEG